MTSEQLNSISKNEEDGTEKHLYKVIVVGDYAVGKTSLIKRCSEGVFSPNYRLTIGVDFAVKKFKYDENTEVSLQLWDIAGHERFGTMTRVYYKYAIAGIVVFDLSRAQTFDGVLKWRDDIHSKVSLANGDPIPLILLANKADLQPDINKEQLDKFVKDYNFVAWFPVSAQENTGIDDSIRCLVGSILKVSQSNFPKKHQSETVKLANNREERKPEEESKCCN